MLCNEVAISQTHLPSSMLIITQALWVAQLQWSLLLGYTSFLSLNCNMHYYKNAFMYQLVIPIKKVVETIFPFPVFTGHYTCKEHIGDINIHYVILLSFQAHLSRHRDSNYFACSRGLVISVLKISILSTATSPLLRNNDGNSSRVVWMEENST